MIPPFLTFPVHEKLTSKSDVPFMYAVANPVSGVPTFPPCIFVQFVSGVIKSFTPAPAKDIKSLFGFCMLRLRRTYAPISFDTPALLPSIIVELVLSISNIDHTIEAIPLPFDLNDILTPPVKGELFVSDVYTHISLLLVTELVMMLNLFVHVRPFPVTLVRSAMFLVFDCPACITRKRDLFAPGV